MMNGDTSDKSALVFDKVNGNLTLSRVQVEGFGYTYDIIGNIPTYAPTLTH